MRAQMAFSRTITPHRGRFVNTRKVTSTSWHVDNIPHIHLEISRDGGPYIVVRMDIEAAREIAEDILSHVIHATGEEHSPRSI